MPPNDHDPAAAEPASPDRLAGASPSEIPGDVPTRRPASTLWPLLAAGGFMLIGVLVLQYLGRTPPPILDGPMPDTELIGLLNADAELSDAEVAGRVVVYHFWGTWCPPCREEYPAFAELAAGYQGVEDVRIVSVSCSPAEEKDLDALREDTRQYLQQLGRETMPVYCDPTAYTRIQILNLLGTGGFSYPTTILVDKRGTVRAFYAGMTDMEQLQEEIESLRKQPFS